MKTEYIICVCVFILVVIVIIITLTKNKHSSFTNKEQFVDETTSTKKTLKYFGGGYCPFSNRTSKAYTVIKEFDELDKYKDVQVDYYWTEENQNDMEKYDIMYVPTILGKDDKPIELKLPDNYDTAEKSPAQIKEALMEQIYILL